nr:uncharacterized protein LOC124814372 [Hydra vulgaris]
MGEKAVSSKTKWQVIEMHKMKINNREIGRRLNISEFSVRTTTKNYLSTGSVHDKPRTGRPKKLTARDENMLYMLNRCNLKAGVSTLSAEINSSLVDKTKKQEVCSSQKYRKIFEATPIKPYSKRRWFRRHMGCISGSGVGCHKIYEGRLNQYEHCDILENALIPSRDLFQADQNWLFQQDNSPCHTAHSITDHFLKSNIQLMPWPARSPDLNPIENLWSKMDYQLTKKQITSQEMLKQELTKLWLEIPIKMIENLI